MSERMFAYGLSGSELDYVDRPLQRRQNLEAKWTRERKLIAVKLREPADFNHFQSAPGESVLIEREVYALADFEIIPYADEDEDVAAPPQLELWSDAAFSPSAALLDMWKSGIAFYLAAARKEEVGVLSGSTFSQTMRAQFSEQLIGALVSEFRSRRGSEPSSQTFISKSGEFEPHVEIMLSNLFPIKPTDLSTFLRQLGVEIVEHFSNGFQLRGEWGKVAARNGEVVVHLTALELPVYEKANKRSVDIDL